MKVTAIDFPTKFNGLVPNMRIVSKYYYGVRCGNVRKNITPSRDLFEKYFTSSKYVKVLLNDGILPFEIIIHKVFNTHREASDFEISFLKRLNVRHRSDFLNQTDTFNNALPNNLGRKLSEQRRTEMSIISSEVQKSKEYRLLRSINMKRKWSDPEYLIYMKHKNNEFWKGEEGLKFSKKRPKHWIGKKHSLKTKAAMSLSAKLACKKIDCKQRAFNRKRFICPICNLSNLDGGNFNRHMKNSHIWDNYDCVKFKDLIKETHQ